jgi:hypothetical protein
LKNGILSFRLVQVSARRNRVSAAADTSKPHQCGFDVESELTAEAGGERRKTDVYSQRYSAITDIEGLRQLDRFFQKDKTQLGAYPLLPEKSVAQFSIKISFMV